MTATEWQKLWHFFIVHFSRQANKGKHSLPLGYATDYKFGFDFGYRAKLIQWLSNDFSV